MKWSSDQFGSNITNGAFVLTLQTSHLRTSFELCFYYENTRYWWTKEKVGETNAQVQEFLNSILPRNDYKGLLKLCQIFLGTMDDEKIKFYKPGAFHHARWMSKAIYTIKIYIFRDIYKLDTELKKKSIRYLFIYVPFWLTVPRAALSPNLDL